MATRKKAPQTLVLDSTQLEDSDYATTLDYPDDVQASLCPSCGELMAWHEVACSTTSTTAPNQVMAEVVPISAPSLFAYDLGQPVLPAPNAQARPVIWRGQLKARHPRTGLVHRINVYRLDNGYWDCYYESDLQAA